MLVFYQKITILLYAGNISLLGCFERDIYIEFQAGDGNQDCHRSWKVLDFEKCPGKSLKVLEFSKF